jgi:sulfide:quinone oxidoreductase
MASARPLQVVVAGGGIAALELLLALRAAARGAVDVTMVAPLDELVYRPESVAAPFGRLVRRYDLHEIADALGARLLSGAVAAVDTDGRRVVLADGGDLGYEALVVSVGSRGVPAVADAITFRPSAAEGLQRVVSDLEAGVIEHVAFVVPPGSGWALPVYELALMTATRARAAGVQGPGTVTIVTPEPAPLGVLRGPASDAVARRLEARGVRVLAGRTVAAYREGTLELAPDGPVVAADRVVALPVLTGPGVEGLPLRRGFIAVDAGFAVLGAPGAWAIGDAADYPVKQGGLAAQQADTVAASVARAAGATVPPHPFAGRIRATLWTGEAPLYLSVDLRDGEPVASDASERARWWPTDKVAGTHIAPFLLDVDEAGVTTAVARADARTAHPAPGGALLRTSDDQGILPLDREA